MSQAGRLQDIGAQAKMGVLEASRLHDASDSVGKVLCLGS